MSEIQLTYQTEKNPDTPTMRNDVRTKTSIDLPLNDAIKLDLEVGNINNQSSEDSPPNE